MKYSVLYYPKFEPDQKWLRSTLLFVDEIQRIIPAEACHTDSAATQRLLDLIPDSFTTIVPSQTDKYFDDLNFSRLEKALDLIRSQMDGTVRNSVEFQIDRQGNTWIKGNVWLSSSKLEERVRELLFEYNLVNKTANSLMDREVSGDLFPVNEAAGNLIVSYVADRIARRTGLDTITDVAIPYTVQSLDALAATPASLYREGEGLLAAAVANLAIPDGIEHLDVHEYQELRQSFQDIRAPFNDLIRSLSIRLKLDGQQSATALEIRVQKAIAEYQKQMADYKNSAASKMIDNWTFIGLQGMLGISSDFSSGIIQAIQQTGIIGLNVMREYFTSKDAKNEHDGTFRMLCQLEKNISKRDSVARLI